MPTAFWDSLSVLGVRQAELQTKTKQHTGVDSLCWYIPLSPSPPAALPAMTCDEKMAWNSTEPWRAGDVECQSRDKGNFSSALRVQCPRGAICACFAPFLCDAT